MEDITLKLQESFRAEAYDLVLELEASLLELESRPGEAEIIDRAFRAMHTIKGSSGTCGFRDISGFTHDLETAFDLLRKGTLTAGKELIDLGLKAADAIKGMFDGHYKGTAVDPAKARAVSQALLRFLPAKDKAPEPPPAAAAAPAALATYRIGFKPARALFTTGADPLLLLRELRQMGSCTLIPRAQDVPELSDLQAEDCLMSWDAILTTKAGRKAVEDVFIFVKDDAAISLETIAPDPGGNVAATAAVIPEQGRTEAAATIRVPTQRLDTLLDLVGELVTVQARLSQAAPRSASPEVLAVSEEVERLTGSLRDNAMSLRMLPIGTAFSRFKRVVRDLAQELGKEVDLETAGGETELDKTVVERLSDPMVHILRNSIDHGVETPEERLAAGKPRRGVIRICAAHSGAHVVITLEDDGAGLDPVAILMKAVAKGLIPRGTMLSEKEIFSLVLLPGFSTARKVSDVSGRGVGMDVVKKTLESLQGTLEIESARGRWTRFTMRLPLTLAIIDGLLVRIADQRYILPLSSVRECIELTRADIRSRHGRDLVRLRDEVIPYIPLRREFALQGHPPEIEHIVIAEVGGAKIGLVVDEVLGGHQTVIKNLGRYHRGADSISGASILGDGSVALIMDVGKIAGLVERAQNGRTLNHGMPRAEEAKTP